MKNLTGAKRLLLAQNRLIYWICVCIFVTNDMCGQTPFTATLGGFNSTTSNYNLVFNPNSPSFATSLSAFGKNGLTSDADGTTYCSFTKWDNQSNYFYYTIASVVGYKLIITDINSNIRSSNKGPKNVVVEISNSLDGVWVQIAMSSLSGTTASDVNATGLSITVNSGETLYIRYRNASTISANGEQVMSVGTSRINSGSVAGTFIALDPNHVNIPTFSPAAGTYTSAQSVSLSSTTSGAKIYYTTNGTEPSSASTLYSSAINVSATTTIKAIAYDSNDANPSEIATSTYTITSITPAISVAETFIPAFAINVGSTDTEVINVSGSNLTSDIFLGISGVNADQFSVTSSIIQSGGTAFGIATITYTPTVAGTHTATLTLSSTGSDDKTLSLSGTATYGPLDAPVALAATDIILSGFTANWASVSGSTGYNMNVYTKSETTASDLFISEYGEGSSNNKYIEIFNGTGGPVDLSGYVLKQSYNGTGWPTDTDSPYYLPLTGTLESNDVFVVSASDANSTILSCTDMKIIQSTTSQGGKTASFTGNDALGLFKNDVLIDVFGDPSSSLTISVAGYSTYGQDHTIVRKSTVTAGNTNWANSSGTNKTDSEWIGYVQDTWTYIGSHTMGSGLISTPISGSPFEVTETSKTVSGLNPATNYYYTVVAKNAHATSSASNEISVTTDNHLSVSGNVNISLLTNCPACDVVVGDGAHLTVDAAKTFNRVTVQPTGKLTVNDGVTLTVPVTIKSTSAGTATAIGAVTGSSSVEQYLPGDGRSWWYLSSPVTGAASTLFGGDSVGQYNEATTSYSSPFSTATNLVAGTGYVVKRVVTTAGTYTFEGTLNNGDITMNPTRTGTTAGKRGFNLIGNPYPSYLDWNAAYADAATSNIRNAIWYRTYSGGQMTFHTYADADGVPEITTGIIPPAQAFWIRVNDDGSNGAITFKNTHRSHAGATANPLKAPKINDRPRVRLQVSNGVNTDEALIVAKSYASNGIDNYDIEKMSNSNVEIPEIYSLLNNQEMVINSLNGFTAGQQIALGFRPGKAGEFTISSTQFENVPSEVKVVLKDQLTGVETELNDGVSYSFSSDATTTDNRFVVSFRAPGTTTGTDIIGDASLQVYAQASEIVITSAALTGSSISVFSATGQRLFSGLANNNREVVTGNFTPGVYFVKVNAVVKKVSVK